MTKRIVVTGSLAYDHIMSMPSSFSDHIMPDKIHILNVSFIMQTFRREFGGSAGNDFGPYFNHLKSLRFLDSSGVKVFKDLQTALGFVTTDKNDNQIWGFYEGAMKKCSNISLKKIINNEDFVVIAPNDPVAVIKFVRECVEKRVPYLYDPAFNIPHYGKRDLNFAIKNAAIIIGNDYEIELIKRRIGLKSLPKNNQVWITTLGSRGSLINEGKSEWQVPPAKPLNTSDPTGAGDAFRAGFLAGFLRGFPLEVCGKMGSLSAVYTVENYGTQTHKFTIKEFKERFAKNFKKKLNL